ncbi:uncharacterized protein LOC119670342 [Teleopsis dalmanni]|uniref:uncharacterized protein LOC119670337 n=1 Tax=Teleopsis dalmanni TaxID=139649 RepID=UPI0018CDABAA|nr:uncharacterized protein LOC119670337 [Teleopsis dalmanni]XP_037936495.1 uncharacterized protein LOC119670342 [Teleopsis dalmanni]
MPPVVNLTKFSLVLLILSIFTNSVKSQTQSWTCDSSPIFKFNPELISGVWYEAARIPKADVPACLKVIAPPASEVSDNYTLTLDFRNNVNNKWNHEIDTVVFPWNDYTKNGTFDLVYGTGSLSVTITFKLIGTDYKNIALVCGYTKFLSSAALIKVMTRQQTISPSIMNTVQKYADQYGIGSQITWVEQSEKCNNSNILRPGLLLLLVLVYGIIKTVTKL